jgi:hypothetical protein
VSSRAYEGDAEPRVRGDVRKRASLACGYLVASPLSGGSTRALAAFPVNVRRVFQVSSFRL